MRVGIAIAMTGVGLALTSAQFGAAYAVPRTLTYFADPGTEHKLATVVGVGGADVCVSAHDAVTGTPIPAHYRRSRNGHPKDLSIHTGRTCFSSKSGSYVLYGSPATVRTKFLVESEAEPVRAGFTLQTDRNPRLQQLSR